MAGSGVLLAEAIWHFAKVGVEGSNPFARSSFSMKNEYDTGCLRASAMLTSIFEVTTVNKV